MKPRAKRILAGGLKNLLILIALVAGFLVLVGGFSLLRDRTCDRLDAERVALLVPGHDTPGPRYVYVRGMGTDRSQLTAYQEAEAALMEADCPVPRPP
jgi:hypothetical protein